MSGSGGKPESNTPQGWLEMVNALTAVCRQSRLGIPILYGVDTNHGHSNVPSATIFPHFIGLGATHDADLVRRIGQATGLEMRASNIFWSFSPDLDVITDTRWGRTYESFGSDPAVVAELGRAYIEGLQDNSGNGMKTMATAKHYLGTGAMEWKSSTNKNFLMDQGVTSADETVLRTVHLPPFKAAVDSGVMSIMAGLNSWQGQKMAANTYLLTNVLKEEMGFEGFIVSDWYGVYEISPNKYESLVTAVNAGVDMIMLPFDYKSFVTYMERAIQTGDISSERLDDAVRRILWTKFKLGLFDNDAANAVDLSVLGSKQHRELAREAVRKSLVLLKNEHNVLPLSKQVSSIVVSGQSADNLGRQSGGWTVEWQGTDGNWIPGTTLLAGIKAAVSSDTEVKFSPAGNFPTTNKADIGIAIVGEKPYAEGWGDTEYPALSETDLQTIQKTKAASKNLIVIILSGRPLDIKKHHQDWDAVVAAWLPGSEGQGVADVLFGDYPFTGTLPVTWELN
ncbi:glycoside hydrolase family 3 protein [Patescibacteria group bacterium]|nr:glycoside hydrolase family 3 protein [Patescibacteria group bacterium]